MHKAQYDEKRLALSEAGNVDDIYDLLAAHEHKVPTADQVQRAHMGSHCSCPCPRPYWLRMSTRSPRLTRCAARAWGATVLNPDLPRACAE